MRPVLLLNRSEEVIDVISWQRAVTLMLQGKAECPWLDVELHEIKTVTGVFRLPSVLILAQYVKLPFKRAAVSKENVLKRDNYSCGFCGKRLTNSTGTIEHLLPQSRGGKHEWMNVIAACKSCNNKKDNLTLKEAEKKFEMRLRKKPFAPSRNFIVLTGINIETCKTWSRWIPVE